MEKSKVNKLILSIEKAIKINANSKTRRNYGVLLKRLGMARRRDRKKLETLREKLAQREIECWSDGKRLENLMSRSLKKNSIIYFQKIGSSNDRKTGKGKFFYAGTINVVQGNSPLEPYPHQILALNSLDEKIPKNGENNFAGLLVLPTGGGKTYVAARWLSKNFLDKGKAILWVAHRHELLEQAFDTFRRKVAYSDIFSSRKEFKIRMISGVHDRCANVESYDDVLIVTKDSLNSGFKHIRNKWRNKLRQGIFLVIDEAHHATAKTYRQLIENIKKEVKGHTSFHMLGLTATPTRTVERERGLLKKVFVDDIVYKSDLKTLIRRGILSEPMFEHVSTSQNFVENLSKEEIQRIVHFDISSIGDDIANEIAKNRERNALIVDRYLDNQARYGQTIVFALNIPNAIALNKLFNEKGVKSNYVVSGLRDSATKARISPEENRRRIKSYRNKELDVLINVNILTEGLDVPNTQSIFLTRPTISTILMTQMVGRGLRGPEAGGTKKAYIVSFIDDWEDKIAWVNPEKLFIEENVDFDDSETETERKVIQLIAISKIEEFALLANNAISSIRKKYLEEIDFIRRIPKGLIHFRYLQEAHGMEEPVEKNCEVIVYDNLEKPYLNYLESLSDLIHENNWSDRTYLKQQELDWWAEKIEEEYFAGVEKYPAYSKEDIKDILQYYIIHDEKPHYAKLEDRDKYDIKKIAEKIIDGKMRPQEKAKRVNDLWEQDINNWQAFFNREKRFFIAEIDLAIRKLTHPEVFYTANKKPNFVPEDRGYEKMSLHQIKNEDAEYAAWLRHKVFEAAKTRDGYYKCALSGFKSKNRLSFQIDHIIPMAEGGLTRLDNLQLLTRRENALKGSG